MKASTLSYLALGDSYTIGESVPLYDNFPYQAVQLLRKSGTGIHAPEIIAKTGWTTDELEQGISHTILQDTYDIVSLLIGVNNQYRGRPVQDYEPGFERLLKKAIELTAGKERHVFVLSIPDWGITPFAKDRNNAQIAAEIDAYNEANRRISLQYGVHYIDITPGTREAANDETLLAADQLHPSGKEYARWAEALSKRIFEVIQGSASL